VALARGVVQTLSQPNDAPNPSDVLADGFVAWTIATTRGRGWAARLMEQVHVADTAESGHGPGGCGQLATRGHPSRIGARGREGRLRGVAVQQQIFGRDIGRRNEPVVLLLHDLDLTLVQRYLEHGDQIVLRELGENGATDQVR